MDWTAPIDAYCERTDPTFWAEPLNAVSNLAFIAAALYGLLLARRCGRIDPGVLALALIAGAVGTGSFLFHTFANRWSALADVIPIAVFIATGFGLVMHRLVGLRPWVAVAATVAFMGLSEPLGGLMRPLLGSSASYGPALAALLLVGAGLVAKGVGGGRSVLAAGLVFSVSIGFRMADLPLCDALPTGTHVGWHLFNGLVLALVMRSVARP